MIALLVPVTGPVEQIELDGTLEQLQQLVADGGNVEAIGLPGPVLGPAADRATAYVDENGKGKHLMNRRATDFMVPGVGLLFGDYIAGPMLLCGFEPLRGEHADLPPHVTRRVHLIEREAGL